MILSRAPTRITPGGGGTDLKSYCSKYGGSLIANVPANCRLGISSSFTVALLNALHAYNKVQQNSILIE